MKTESYKVIFDAGKSYEKEYEGEEELHKALSDFYHAHKNADEFPYVDVFIYNNKGEDISESQFVQEMILDILEKD